MRMRYLYFLIAGLLVIFSTAIVAADQIELTDRELPGGEVERFVYDTDTQEITEFIDGVPAIPRPATAREIAAANRLLRQENAEAAGVTLEALLLDMEANPSINPNTLRLEQAILALAEAQGIR